MSSECPLGSAYSLGRSQKRSISKIRLRGVCVFLHPQLFHSASAQLIHICKTVGYAINPTLQPGIGIRPGFRLLVVLTKESVVALVVSLHWRRMSPIAALDHRIDQKSGNHGAIGIARDSISFYDFFGYHD